MPRYTEAELRAAVADARSMSDVLRRFGLRRPPYEQLLAEIAATSWSAVGREYGVSDNAIRKWVRAYEAGRRAAAREPPAPERGPPARVRSGRAPGGGRQR